MLTLETERLVLRQFLETDLDGYRRMVNDPDVMRIQGDTETMTAFQCWRSLAMYQGHWQFRGYGPFAVIDKASGAFVGRIGPWFPEGWPGLELLWMVDRAYWGRGIAPEAAAAARDWVFSQLGTEIELISLIFADNTASRRVAEKLGARYARDTELQELPGMPIGVWVHSPAGAGL
jgi:RimJ/RimL family protein N-acetyltransferase